MFLLMVSYCCHVCINVFQITRTCIHFCTCVDDDDDFDEDGNDISAQRLLLKQGPPPGHHSQTQT